MSLNTIDVLSPLGTRYAEIEKNLYGKQQIQRKVININASYHHQLLHFKSKCLLSLTPSLLDSS